MRPRFVGITATTPLIVNGLKIAEICKMVFPDTRAVFGGVHTTVMPEEVLREECVDYVVRGEGEETVKQLLTGEDESLVEYLPEDKHNTMHKKPDIAKAKKDFGHNPKITL